MFDFDQNNSLAAARSKLFSIDVPESTKTLMGMRALEISNEALSNSHFIAMLQERTLGSMVNYFKTSKDAGADKIGRDTMAAALMTAAGIHNATLEMTQILTSFRRFKKVDPETEPGL